MWKQLRIHRTTAMLLLLGSAALLAACGKKPAPAPAPVVPQPEVSLPPPPKPAVEFEEPDQQARYEQTFERLAEVFVPPATGTLVAVKLEDGTFIGGSLAKLDSTQIVVKAGKQEFVANREDLDPDAEAELYVDAFARQYALAEISDPLPPLDTKPGTQGTLYALNDDVKAHAGPSFRFPLVTDINIPKGTRLDVQHRRGRWLRVSAPALQKGLSFWVDYFQTMPLVDDLKADYRPFVNLLIEDGLLKRINPVANEAFVVEEAWEGTDAGIQEGISRTLAAHIAQVRHSTVMLVEIKGSQSNRRLANYTRNQGFHAF